MKRLAGWVALAAALSFPSAYVHADWDDDNWGTDDYGYYDEDFAWDSDEDFDNWYADSDQDWNAFYDDVGDEGIFDV